MDPRSSASDGQGRVQSTDDGFVEGYGGGAQRNPKTQPGNGDGQGRLQPGGGLSVEGYPERDSRNTVAKGGRPIPEQGPVRGYGGNGHAANRNIATRRANDGVGGFDRTAP